MKLILSIIIGLILIVPTCISFLIFKKKNQIKWMYGGILLTLIFTILLFYILMEIRLPNNSFSEDRFKETYKEIFHLDLQSGYEIIDKKYEKESGLFGSEIWTVRISLNGNDYLKLLDYVKTENEMQLKDYNENPLIDCETTDKIVYSIQTTYMNPWNYNINFFDDKKTIRMEIIVNKD